MITFKEFDEAITNVAINAVFPKRDLYKKTIYSHDNNDDEIGMSYTIMPFGSEISRIGFIQEPTMSMFTVWNGKLDHIVFDVDERDGCIRYYHEPELYDRDNGLSHSQIHTIGQTLIKYLTSNKEEEDCDEPEETKQKKHPLQNSPTFPEEESAEEERMDASNLKNDKRRPRLEDFDPAVMVYDGEYEDTESPCSYKYEYVNCYIPCEQFHHSGMVVVVYKITKTDPRIYSRYDGRVVTRIVGICNSDQYMLMITNTKKFWDKYVEPRIQELEEMKATFIKAQEEREGEHNETET